jgi:uncharacterized protein (DUF39 family)
VDHAAVDKPAERRLQAEPGIRRYARRYADQVRASVDAAAHEAAVSVADIEAHHDPGESTYGVHLIDDHV